MITAKNLLKISLQNKRGKVFKVLVQDKKMYFYVKFEKVSR